MLKGNIHIVGRFDDDSVAFTNPPKPGTILTRTEALEFAAWIVALAEDPDQEDEFERVLEEVRNT